MFVFFILSVSAHYYLRAPLQFGGYPTAYGYGPSPSFELDPRGVAVFHDGIDAKPAGMFIAAGMDPKFLPMATDGFDAGDQWIYGIPGMTKQQVIDRAKGMYPRSAALGHPSNEELAPEWGSIVANGFLVDPNAGITGGNTGGTANSQTVNPTDPEGTVVLKAGLYTVLGEGADSSTVTVGTEILTPGTYRVPAASSGAGSRGTAAWNLIHYGEEEWEGPEMEGAGLVLSRPRYTHYAGCAPQDWVIGVGCIRNLRMRTPYLAKPQWRRKL